MAQRSGVLCPGSHSQVGLQQDEEQVGIETTGTNHPPVLPVSSLRPHSRQVSSPSRHSQGVSFPCTRPAPPAPLGSCCPESGKFPRPGRDKAAPAFGPFDRRPDGSAGLAAGEAATAIGGAGRGRAWYQPPGGGTSCHLHSNGRPSLQTGSCFCTDVGRGGHGGDPGFLIC